MTGAVLLAAGCAKQTAPVEGGGPEDLAIRVTPPPGGRDDAEQPWSRYS